MTEKSFISEARRAQITRATVATLDEIGFANASLAQIARRAGTSTALISYHFENKDALMNHTMMTLLQSMASFVMEETGVQESSRQQLHAYIKANLSYGVEHPAHYVALLEILFNARTPEGIPYYKLEDADDDEPLTAELQRILTGGQKRGEFREFNVRIMAHTIQGAIWEYVTNPGLMAIIDAATYGQELIGTFDRAISVADAA